MTVIRKHWTDEHIREIARDEVRVLETRFSRELDRLREEFDATRRALESSLVKLPWWRRILNRKPSHASQ